ncbi:argininosuccinate synthase [PVC group bacterium (ex Bugula neritina AB1)]|nr:argininosuccinate synthase [PVC group bacterium (ex Bugula neritina AB1)]
MKKVVLAYSGGLDTSVIIPWLREKYGNDLSIVCYAADLGQGKELEPLKEKAIKSGANDIYIDDLKKEFLTDYVYPALKAGALYEGQYPLATALGRPLIAKKMVEVALKENADAVCHGCTGKGNDQVRFDLAFATLAPHLKIIAPLREWDMKSREEEIEYAQKHGIDVPVTKQTPYSLDLNLWGQSIECGVLENPWTEPPEDAYKLTQAPEQASDTPAYITVSFDKGIPKSVDGTDLEPLELVEKLAKLGYDHGIGRIDMVENRLVGIKSREIYEAPVATILFEAHKALEGLTLEREVSHYKQKMSHDYANMVYYGQWFSPLRQAMDAFITSTQEWVTGDVRLKLFKGSVTVVGRKSPNSLYDEALATYTEEDVFDHASAEGFIRCFGLPLQVTGSRDLKSKK